MNWTSRTLGLAAVAATAVAVLIGLLLGVVPTWPGAVHLLGLPPLDLMADARWLLTTSTSWPRFLAASLALLAWRVVVLALLLGDGRRPAWRVAATFYAVAVAPSYLVAQLDFAAHAVLYSRLYGAALGLGAIAALILLPAPWSTGQRLTNRLVDAARGGFRLAVTVPYLAVLLVIGWLVEVLGPAAFAPGVAAAALAGVAAVRVIERGPAPHPGAAFGIAAVAVLVATALVVTTRGEAWEPTGETREGTLLLMSGINSASGEGAIFELDPVPLGYRCEQTFYFSYAGTGDGQPRGVATCPIRTGAPYVPEHTQRPFGEQVELLQAQAEPLEQPLVVLAHSQAAWVAWAAAAEARLPEDTRLVLIGPFPSSPVGYPAPDEHGPGRVAGDLLRLLEPLPQLADFDFLVDAPLAREVLARTDAASEILEQPLRPGQRALAVTATPDLALMPAGWRLAHAADACPVREAHPYLPLTPGLLRQVDRFLADLPEERCARWPEVYRQATAAISVPGQQPR